MLELVFGLAFKYGPSLVSAAEGLFSRITHSGQTHKKPWVLSSLGSALNDAVPDHGIEPGLLTALLSAFIDYEAGRQFPKA